MWSTPNIIDKGDIYLVGESLSIKNMRKSFPGKGNPRDEEILNLKKQLANIQEEYEILKKRWLFSQNDRNNIYIYKKSIFETMHLKNGQSL